ncbi:MAG: hypothetical protein WC861_05365 [Candidatus Micrarchaeia archaeon]|jgi:hypothetical protein
MRLCFFRNNQNSVNGIQTPAKTHKVFNRLLKQGPEIKRMKSKHLERMTAAAGADVEGAKKTMNALDGLKITLHPLDLATINDAIVRNHSSRQEFVDFVVSLNQPWQGKLAEQALAADCIEFPVAMKVLEAVCRYPQQQKHEILGNVIEQGRVDIALEAAMKEMAHPIGIQKERMDAIGRRVRDHGNPKLYSPLRALDVIGKLPYYRQEGLLVDVLQYSAHCKNGAISERIMEMAGKLPPKNRRTIEFDLMRPDFGSLKIREDIMGRYKGRECERFMGQVETEYGLWSDVKAANCIIQASPPGQKTIFLGRIVELYRAKTRHGRFDEIVKMIDFIPRAPSEVRDKLYIIAERDLSKFCATAEQVRAIRKLPDERKIGPLRHVIKLSQYGARDGYRAWEKSEKEGISIIRELPANLKCRMILEGVLAANSRLEFIAMIDELPDSMENDLIMRQLREYKRKREKWDTSEDKLTLELMSVLRKMPPKTMAEISASIIYTRGYGRYGYNDDDIMLEARANIRNLSADIKEEFFIDMIESQSGDLGNLFGMIDEFPVETRCRIIAKVIEDGPHSLFASEIIEMIRGLPDKYKLEPLVAIGNNWRPSNLRTPENVDWLHHHTDLEHFGEAREMLKELRDKLPKNKREEAENWIACFNLSTDIVAGILGNRDLYKAEQDYRKEIMKLPSNYQAMPNDILREAIKYAKYKIRCDEIDNERRFRTNSPDNSWHSNMSNKWGQISQQITQKFGEPPSMR